MKIRIYEVYTEYRALKKHIFVDILKTENSNIIF